MLGTALKPDIEELVEARDWDTLRAFLVELSVADVAEVLEELPAETAALIFRVLTRAVSAEVFTALSLETQERLLRSLSDEKVAGILNDMPPDDRTRLLEELPGVATQHMLNLLTAEERKVAVSLLGYPEQSVGRLMTPDYIIVQPSWTINRALDHVRKWARHSETANVIYVVDEKLHLRDELKLAQIVVAQPTQLISELMDNTFVALKASDDREAVIPIFKKYARMALPVTDTDGVLVGLVTLDDVLTVAEEEATEDIQKIGGMAALDAPYISTPVGELIRKRAGWLMVLFVGEMFTATAMARFEHEIAKAVVLAMFVPLIISSGGNSGSQAASLLIRALAVGEVKLRDWWLVMRRELFSGLALGVILGTVGFVRIWAWHMIWPEVYGPHWFLLGITIWLTLIGVVLGGSLAGSMLPMLLKRIGWDPAVSSAPFVATLVDVTGLIIYFEIAAWVLRGTIL